jgi:nucleotide-binding universal stress UspA family protein
MFETAIIATDGSDSTTRAVTVALDVAARFDATVHALYVVDESDVQESPEQLRADLQDALETESEDALASVRDHADREITTAVREGEPAVEICDYVEAVDADVVATGTRGRHGDHSVLLGSVAESVVRRCPVPVLTVRQLGEDEQRPDERSPY